MQGQGEAQPGQVGAGEREVGRGGEIEDPSRPQHPRQVAEVARALVDVLDHLVAQDEVEGPAREGQAHAVALHEPGRAHPLLGHEAGPRAREARVDVEPGHEARLLGQGQRRAPRAAARVQHPAPRDGDAAAVEGLQDLRAAQVLEHRVLVLAAPAHRPRGRDRRLVDRPHDTPSRTSRSRSVKNRKAARPRRFGTSVTCCTATFGHSSFWRSMSRRPNCTISETFHQAKKATARHEPAPRAAVERRRGQGGQAQGEAGGGGEEPPHAEGAVLAPALDGAADPDLEQEGRRGRGRRAAPCGPPPRRGPGRPRRAPGSRRRGCGRGRRARRRSGGSSSASSGARSGSGGSRRRGPVGQELGHEGEEGRARHHEAAERAALERARSSARAQRPFQEQQGRHHQEEAVLLAHEGAQSPPSEAEERPSPVARRSAPPTPAGSARGEAPPRRGRGRARSPAPRSRSRGAASRARGPAPRRWPAPSPIRRNRRSASWVTSRPRNPSTAEP